MNTSVGVEPSRLDRGQTQLSAIRKVPPLTLYRGGTRCLLARLSSKLYTIRQLLKATESELLRGSSHKLQISTNISMCRYK